MEVHAHTHTPRKKWTHYFWEFLMLFLAVFCGFLAENEREHYIEHLREKQYMRSLLEDLRADTVIINRVYNRALYQRQQLDSLIETGNNSTMNEENISKLYLYHNQTTRFLNIRLEDRTTSQLKNAGGMRLIRNKDVSTAIRKYWDNIEMLYTVRDRLESAGEKISDVSARIFSNKYLIRSKNPLDPPEGIKPGAVFINDDPKLLAEYINRVVTKSIRTNIYIGELEETSKMANRLIDLLVEKYHLK